MTKMTASNPNFKQTEYIQRNSEQRKVQGVGLFDSVASRKTQKITSHNIVEENPDSIAKKVKPMN